MEIYSTAEELRVALNEVNPSKIAVAYIGKGWETFLLPDSLKEIILSPTVGSNPYAIRQVIDKLGIENVHFLDTLHAKIYIGSQSALFGSCNLSNNGFSDDRNFEVGTIFSKKEDLERLNEIFDDYRTKANEWYSDADSKEKRLEELYEQWQKSKENATDSPLTNSGEEDAPLLSDWKPDECERIHIAYYYYNDTLTHDDERVVNAARQDDVTDNIARENSFLEKDEICKGDWILGWLSTGNGFPDGRSNPSWLYVHRVIPEGTTEVDHEATDYTKLVIQWESKDCPPEPFELDPLAIERFRDLISMDEFEQLRPPENEDGLWSLSVADTVVPGFLAALREAYIENLTVV